MKNYDTWEKTEAAGRALYRIMHLLHEIKPEKCELEELQRWEAELKEVRAWAVSIHNRRIALNMERMKCNDTTRLQELGYNDPINEWG